MERSKHLHNFNLPPQLTWGRQKSLRCMNVIPIPPIPAVDDDESSDSGDYNRHVEDEEFHKVEAERSSDDRRRMTSSCNTPIDKIVVPIKAKPSPRPPTICSEGGAAGSEKKSTRSRRNLDKKEERPKFSIQLSRKEIEEDFIAMTGKKPPRKPNNKLSKHIQMKLDDVFPGSCLSEVHPDRYKVNENGKI